jgi:hypothetical protein
MTNKPGATSDMMYVTSFKVRLLGSKCDVEVSVDLHNMTASVVLLMNQLIGSKPAFSISIDDLKTLSTNIKAIHKFATLLKYPSEGANDHQLRWDRGGAGLIIVQPPGKVPRYVLSIGLYHQEGDLSELSTKEIDEAVQKLDSLASLVIKKVKTM